MLNGKWMSIIPPHGYPEMHQSGVYINETLDYSHKIQVMYYSLKVGPLVCSSCVVDLGPEALEKSNKLLETNRTVLPCCGSLACIGKAPTHIDGWVLRSKPKKRKTSQDLPPPAAPTPVNFCL